MLIEQKLPLDVTPEDNTLDDPAQRQRLVRVFDQGLRPPVGYVLPLLVTAGDGGRRRFLTERWAFRRGHLFLVPGDSPIGLRLPLGSLPEITFVDFPNVLPADPFAEQRKLPSGPDCSRGPRRGRGRTPPLHGSDGGAGSWCAPRSPSSRAAGICACSCRRSPTAGTMPR